MKISGDLMITIIINNCNIYLKFTESKYYIFISYPQQETMIANSLGNCENNNFFYISI